MPEPSLAIYLTAPLHPRLAHTLQAQGLWYFTYSNCIVNGSQPTSLFPTVQHVNRQLGELGPHVMGRHSVQVLFLGVLAFARNELTRARCSFACVPALQVLQTGWGSGVKQAPGVGRVVQSMSDRLLVGVLLNDTDSRDALLIVVDSRWNVSSSAAHSRNVTLQLAPTVALEPVMRLSSVSSAGSIASVPLLPGDARVFRLRELVPGALLQLMTFGAPLFDPVNRALIPFGKVLPCAAAARG